MDYLTRFVINQGSLHRSTPPTEVQTTDSNTHFPSLHQHLIRYIEPSIWARSGTRTIHTEVRLDRRYNSCTPARNVSHYGVNPSSSHRSTSSPRAQRQLQVYPATYKMWAHWHDEEAKTFVHSSPTDKLTKRVLLPALRRGSPSIHNPQ